MGEGLYNPYLIVIMYISMDTSINKTMSKSMEVMLKVYTQKNPSSLGSCPTLSQKNEWREICQSSTSPSSPSSSSSISSIYPPMVMYSPSLLKEHTYVWCVSKKAWCSAFVFNFSDWWNQTTSGFVLVDLVGHVSAHGLDLNVPWVGIFWFICKPFLF